MKKSIQGTWLFSRADIYSMQLPSASINASIWIRNWEHAFSTSAGGEFGEYSVDGGDQAGFGVVGGYVGDVLDVWLNEVVQRVQVGGGGGPVKEGYNAVALLLKPSQGLFGLVGRRRVLLPHPESATGHLIAPGDHHTLQHIQVHFGADFQADFEKVRWHDVDLTKDHKRSRKLCFHHSWARPCCSWQSRLAFWGCWQWSCCHNCGSVENMSCTAAHLRSRSLNIVSLSDMIEGSYRFWDLHTTGQLVDGLKQKKEKIGFH